MGFATWAKKLGSFPYVSFSLSFKILLLDLGTVFSKKLWETLWFITATHIDSACIVRWLFPHHFDIKYVGAMAPGWWLARVLVGRGENLMDYWLRSAAKSCESENEVAWIPCLYLPMSVNVMVPQAQSQTCKKNRNTSNIGNLCTLNICSIANVLPNISSRLVSM